MEVANPRLRHLFRVPADDTDPGNQVFHLAWAATWLWGVTFRLTAVFVGAVVLADPHLRRPCLPSGAVVGGFVGLGVALLSTLLFGWQTRPGKWPFGKGWRLAEIAGAGCS